MPADERPVEATEIDDLECCAEPQDRVLARYLPVVDANIAVLAATERELARLRKRLGGGNFDGTVFASRML